MNDGRNRKTMAQLLRVPYRALVGELYERLKKEGYPELQPAHSSVFPYIRDGVGRASELAVKANLTKQSVAYLVESLEEAGLVERARDPVDRRANVLRLTPRGQAAERAASRIIKGIEATWANTLGSTDAAHMRRSLERLCIALEANEHE